MSDRKRLQRTLFRMQIDPAFADAVLARDSEAVASTGLAVDDLALILAVDPRAVAADPGGRRRTQVLGNAASEYTASLAAAATNARTRSLLLDFASSPELHEALAQDGPLPHAFGAFAARVARELDDRLLGALVELERALVRHRRRRAPEPSPAAGEIALSGRAHVLAVPAGTHAAAGALRAALGDGVGRPALGEGEEHLLFLAAVRGSPFRLPEVGVERLDPPADELFVRLARGSIGAEERGRFAAANGAEPAGLDAFLEDFVDEGALVRG